MKNLLVILLMVVTTGLTAQTQYGTYTSNGQTIEASVTKNKGKVYLNLNVKGDHSIIFNNSIERAAFVDFVTTSFTKYVEWETIAKTNNVVDYRRVLEATRTGNNLAWHYGDWQFTFRSVEISSNMWINEEGLVSFYLLIPEQESHNNQYIKSKPQVLTLDADDVASLQLVLSDEVVDAFLNQANVADNPDNLFK